MEYGGNDYPLALTIDLGKMGWNYPVESWQETWERLKNYEKKNNIHTRVA